MAVRLVQNSEVVSEHDQMTVEVLPFNLNETLVYVKCDSIPVINGECLPVANSNLPFVQRGQVLNEVSTLLLIHVVFVIIEV